MVRYDSLRKFPNKPIKDLTPIKEEEIKAESPKKFAFSVTPTGYKEKEKTPTVDVWEFDECIDTLVREE